MNVIPFPRPHRPVSEPRSHWSVVLVTCAIHVLGEPATLKEILDLVRSVEPGLPNLEAEFTAVLEGGTESSFGQRLIFELFRPIPLDGETAWAFTADYRNLMTSAGVAPALRGKQRDQDSSAYFKALLSGVYGRDIVGEYYR